MTGRLPYEEQLADLLDSLPLPDENMAWADMKRRLEEDESRPLLPFWLRGCAGWILMTVVLLGLGWWFMRPEKWLNNKHEKIQAGGENDSTNGTKNDTINYSEDSTRTSKVGILTIKEDSSDLVISKTPATVSVETGDGQKGNKKIVTRNYKDDKTSYSKVNGSKNRKPGKTTPVVTKDVEDKKIKKGNEKENGDSGKTITKIEPAATDSAVLAKSISTELVGDSSKPVKKDSLIKKQDETTVATAKKDSAKKKSFSFSTGLAIHQQIPIAGQWLTPYNELGRKGSWRDYIPSLYIRLSREDKWFIQSGFRYGAPQSENGRLYSAKTDTISIQKYNTTSSYLKKTFYHQVPLTFNYFVSPNLSIGSGVVWNLFSSAVSSRDIIQYDRFTGADTAISSAVIFTTRSTDSNFVKSYFQATFEAQYKWKRFSIGANYSVGLQPYIRFVLPGGVQQQVKNRSLQAFIRYRLWQSKGK